MSTLPTNLSEAQEQIALLRSRLSSGGGGANPKEIKILMERRERMAWHFAGKYDPLADPLDVADNLGWRCDFCGAIIPPSHFQDVNFGNRSGFWVRSYNCDCPAAVASRHALEAMQQAASDAAAQIARDHQLRTAGVTEQQTFATFRPRPDWPELMDKCSTVAEYSQALLNGSLGPRNWLVLMGNYGTGKTHLAAACVMAALEARRGAYFRNWPKTQAAARCVFPVP